MKKLLFTFAVLALLSAAPGPVTASTNEAVAGKSQVCHVTGQANDTADIEGLLVTFGRVIEVNDNAVEAHLDHGDDLNFLDMDADLRAWAEAFYQISLPNADCYMYAY
jgi:hypothetical protein